MQKTTLFSLALLLMSTFKLFAQCPTCDSTTLTNEGTYLSEEQIAFYLSRSISMASMRGIHPDDPNLNCSASNPDDYDGVFSQDLIDRVRATEAKFIGRVALIWGYQHQAATDWWFDSTEDIVNGVKEGFAPTDLDAPVLQAGLMEHITSRVNEVPIPNYVYQAFCLDTPSIVRNFSYNDIRTASSDVFIHPDSGHVSGKPDIRRLETKMWYYYQAKEYIDHGIEAFHIGPLITLIPNKHPDSPESQDYYAHIDDLLSRIRCYGRTKNRGFVLIDAHIATYTPKIGDRLIFDFHSGPTGVREATEITLPDGNTASQNGVITNGEDFNNAVVTFDENCNYGTQEGILDYDSGSLPKLIHRRKISGTTPMGYYTNAHLYISELDHGSNISTNSDSGGGIIDNNNINQLTNGLCVQGSIQHALWGYDEIGWFNNQDTISFQPEWLRYAYHKVQCLNSNGYFQMPGMRHCLYLNADTVWNAIPQIWAEVKNNQLPDDWVHRNFTEEEVAEFEESLYVGDDFVAVNDTLMYYAADDGTIHAYILYNGEWRTTSPSWVAHGNQIPIWQQEKFSRSLVVSPSGDKILYIGEDNKIYGFNILSAWSYEYFDVAANSTTILSNNTHALPESDIVFGNNNEVFFITYKSVNRQLISPLLGNGPIVIHAIFSYTYDDFADEWILSSPSVFSDVFFFNQIPPGRKLFVSPDAQSIYYEGGNDGLFYSLTKSTGSSEYEYSALNSNTQMLAQGISIHASVNPICPSNDRIYYVAKDNNKLLVHALIHDGTEWRTTSPSWVASLPIQDQEDAKELAFSETSNALFYKGTDGQLYGFQLNGNSPWQYEHFDIAHKLNSSSLISSSLNFNANSPNCWFIGVDGRIHEYYFGQSFCTGSSSINTFEDFDFERIFPLQEGATPPAEPASTPQNVLFDLDDEYFNSSKEVSLSVFPNPVRAGSPVTVEMVSKTQQTLQLSVRTAEGQLIHNENMIIDGHNVLSSISNQALKPGMYYISIRAGKQSGSIHKTAKLVVIP